MPRRRVADNDCDLWAGQMSEFIGSVLVVVLVSISVILAKIGDTLREIAKTLSAKEEK